VIGGNGASAAFCLSDAVTSGGWTNWDQGMVWRANGAGGANRGQYANASNDIRCAVCRGTTYTHYGQQTCASGYAKLYSGFVATMSVAWQGGWGPGGTFCLESSAGSNWTNWTDALVVRAIGSSGGNRVQYQNGNDILCNVCY